MFIIRIVFDDCNDMSYELFTEWLTNTRDLFDSILMINTRKDEQTRINHVRIDNFKNNYFFNLVYLMKHFIIA